MFRRIVSTSLTSASSSAWWGSSRFCCSSSSSSGTLLHKNLTVDTKLNAKVIDSLAVWHSLVEKKSMKGLDAILHKDAVFRSPIAFKGYQSAPAVKLVLSTVIDVFENFTYHRSFAGDDSLSVVLEFSADVKGKQLKGIDMIRFDEGGKIVEFEVMVRPLNGLQSLGEEMGARLSAKLPQFKQ